MRRIKHINLSFSSLDSYRKCGTKFQMGYLLKSALPSATSALDFGTLMHRCLEHAFKIATVAGQQSLADTRKVAALEALDGLFPATGLAKDGKRSYEQAKALLEGYFLKWSGDNFEVVAQEKEYKCQLTDRISFNGTFDRLTKQNGVYTLWDVKTSYYLGDSFRNLTKPNHQATGYWLLADMNGFPISEFIFDGLQTAPNKIFKEPLECFERVSTYRTEEDLKEWTACFIKDTNRLIEDIEKNDFSMNAPHACSLYGRCPHADICSISYTDRQEFIKRNYVENTQPYHMEILWD